MQLLEDFVAEVTKLERQNIKRTLTVTINQDCGAFQAGASKRAVAGARSGEYQGERLDFESAARSRGFQLAWTLWSGGLI